MGMDSEPVFSDDTIGNISIGVVLHNNINNIFRGRAGNMVHLRMKCRIYFLIDLHSIVIPLLYSSKVNLPYKQ